MSKYGYNLRKTCYCFTFGKFKDTPAIFAPDWYLSWILFNPKFTDEHVKEQIRLSLPRRHLKQLQWEYENKSSPEVKAKAKSKRKFDAERKRANKKRFEERIVIRKAKKDSPEQTPLDTNPVTEEEMKDWLI